MLRPSSSSLGGGWSNGSNGGVLFLVVFLSSRRNINGGIDRKKSAACQSRVRIECTLEGRRACCPHAGSCGGRGYAGYGFDASQKKAFVEICSDLAVVCGFTGRWEKEACQLSSRNKLAGRNCPESSQV